MSYRFLSLLGGAVTWRKTFESVAKFFWKFAQFNSNVWPLQVLPLVIDIFKRIFVIWSVFCSKFLVASVHLDQSYNVTVWPTCRTRPPRRKLTNQNANWDQWTSSFLWRQVMVCFTWKYKLYQLFCLIYTLRDSVLGGKLS